MEKQCTNCNETKPIEAFHRNKTRIDGRQEHCANCKNDYSKGKYRGIKKASLNPAPKYLRSYRLNFTGSQSLPIRTDNGYPAIYTQIMNVGTQSVTVQVNQVPESAFELEAMSTQIFQANDLQVEHLIFTSHDIKEARVNVLVTINK